MLKIKFRYRDAMSNWQWRTQECCRLERQGSGLIAHPIRGKSGLITTLAGADGYFCIERDCEGLSRGAEIQVTVTTGG